MTDSITSNERTNVVDVMAASLERTANTRIFTRNTFSNARTLMLAAAEMLKRLSRESQRELAEAEAELERRQAKIMRSAHEPPAPASNVQRYNGIEPDPDGVYVLHEDYERLQRENAELLRRNVVLSTALEPCAASDSWRSKYMDEVAETARLERELEEIRASQPPLPKRCEDEHPPISYSGEHCPLCDALQQWISDVNAPRASKPPLVRLCNNTCALVSTDDDNWRCTSCDATFIRAPAYGIQQVLEYLNDRAAWLRSEWKNGGNYEYLHLKEEECLYIAKCIEDTHKRLGPTKEVSNGS